MDFYASLKTSIKNGNTKHPVPENVDAIISAIDQSTESGKEKEHLVAATYLLVNIYKTKVWAARAKNVRLYAQKAIGKKSAKIIPNNDSESKGRGFKINKLDCVSEAFTKSTSQQIKLAVALFLSSNLLESIKRDFINAIINDAKTEKSVQYIADMFVQPQEAVSKIRGYVSSVVNKPLEKSSEKYILCGLIELSELFKDKSYCKLAMKINLERYVQFVQRYHDSGLIHSIAPLIPAIQLYLETSIAQCSQDSERKILYNQFKNDPSGVINIVISGLPESSASKKKNISGVSDKSRIFNADEPYQCHKGPVGYTRDIVATYHRVGHDVYKILTYSDCLYDVIGKTTEAVDATGRVTIIEELFDRICWSDRLKLLPEFRAKVAINTISGADLNDYTGDSSDITVSWFNDDGRSCSKTFIMKKPKNIKIKTEC